MNTSYICLQDAKALDTPNKYHWLLPLQWSKVPLAPSIQNYLPFSKFRMILSFLQGPHLKQYACNN